MKTYMPLDGFRWSCDSDSALCDMRQTNVLGRAGGVENVYYICMRKPRPHCKYRHFHAWRNIDLLVQKMERNAKK